MDEEQERAIRYILETLVLKPVSVNWGMDNIKKILAGEIKLGEDVKLHNEKG